MKIAVVSDTHMPRFAKALPRALRHGLVAHEVGLILHLGDFTAPEVADAFAAIAPFDAVAGNNDGAELRERFGRRKRLDVEGVRIGMTHGDGTRGTTLDRALDAFADDDVDIILFGHSHNPYCTKHGDTWVMNPGSPTDKRRSPRYSWGILEIRDGEVFPSLQYYEDKG
jgi:putative phosphoesterase